MEIKSYSKKELALAYAQELSISGARQRLAFMMNRNPGLMEQLSLTGYRKEQRVLSAMQVKLIFEYLGEP